MVFVEQTDAGHGSRRRMRQERKNKQEEQHVIAEKDYEQYALQS